MNDLDYWLLETRKEIEGRYKLRVEYTRNSGQIVFVLDSFETDEKIFSISSGSDIFQAMRTIDELIAD